MCSLHDLHVHVWFSPGRPVYLTGVAVSVFSLYFVVFSLLKVIFQNETAYHTVKYKEICFKAIHERIKLKLLSQSLALLPKYSELGGSQV